MSTLRRSPSTSSASSFWDQGSDSDSSSDAYSEWRDCLRGMEAKYPRGAAPTLPLKVRTGVYADDPPSYEDATRPTETKNGACLAFFSSLANKMQKSPHQVIHRISGWFLDPRSPAFWLPFALSIRGSAHEQLDRSKYARRDYVEGLQRFYRLRRELGEDAVARLRSNVRFMEYRIVKLGGVVPTDRTARHKLRNEDTVDVYGRGGFTI